MISDKNLIIVAVLFVVVVTMFMGPVCSTDYKKLFTGNASLKDLSILTS